MKTRSKSLTNNFNNWQLISQVKNDSNVYKYRSAINHLRKNYLNPKSGVSFSGVNRIYNFYDKVIPIKEIKEFLSNDNSYTLHSKTFKKRYNPSFIKYNGQQMQADSIDIGNITKEDMVNDIDICLAFILFKTNIRCILIKYQPLSSSRNIRKHLKEMLK